MSKLSISMQHAHKRLIEERHYDRDAWHHASKLHILPKTLEALVERGLAEKRDHGYSTQYRLKVAS